MTEKNTLDLLTPSEYTKQAKDILSFFAPLALKIPDYRQDPALMSETVKFIGKEGITDVVTQVDKLVQEKIKQETERRNWQFWGEEGVDSISTYDEQKQYLLISDPVEGTNNLKYRKDDQWGSVVSLVDIKTKQPVIGIVANPAKRTIYLGIKDTGTCELRYDDKGILVSSSLMSKAAEFSEFTYNNSPYFNKELQEQVDRFMHLGQIQPTPGNADELEKSRKNVIIDGNKFVDPESGALEAVRYKGTIYFKTSNEMAAVFVILNELGGKVTDADGKPWYLGINTMISARNELDYNYLRNLYNKTKV